MMNEVLGDALKGTALFYGISFQLAEIGSW